VFRAGKDLLGDGPWMLVAPIEGLTAFSEKVSAKNVPKPCDAVLPEGFRRGTRISIRVPIIKGFRQITYYIDHVS
jgi:hypothetical protein